VQSGKFLLFGGEHQDFNMVWGEGEPPGEPNITYHNGSDGASSSRRLYWRVALRHDQMGTARREPRPPRERDLADHQVGNNTVRLGKYYEQKRVEVIYTVEGETIVTVTVYVFYGRWEE